MTNVFVEFVFTRRLDVHNYTKRGDFLLGHRQNELLLLAVICVDDFDQDELLITCIVTGQGFVNFACMYIGLWLA